MGLGLEASGISKSYGGKNAISNVSLRVEAGELFSILGPSGSGKSTLLRILNLLERPDSGGVFFHDSSGRRADDKVIRRKMTMLLQRPVMLKDTVCGNVAYGLRVRGLAEEEIYRRVSAALTDMGLGDFGRRKASTLSGGEMQRVAFARAIVLEPELLFLDEFTANLDSSNIRVLESAVQGYMARTKCTVVLVSHNPSQAQRLARQCLFLYGGEVIESGDLSTVRTSEDERISAFFRGDSI